MTALAALKREVLESNLRQPTKLARNVDSRIRLQKTQILFIAKAEVKETGADRG